MTQEINLGKWIRSKYGSQAQFADKIGAHATMVSRWMGGAGISEEYQAKIRKLGYSGPWPEDVKDSAGEALTREEFAEWRGYWKGGMEGVLARLEALEDQVRKLSQPGKPG